ncbi:MAG: ribulose-phosphate 3-epimerase [Candidatus Omnitrophica bacterium]|jgi:ribulose-phosphate 3-epimerase|nr:ribulose-phosphate 3-epimerase [Candidatus Omnitrophota bacterium]
MIVPALLSDKKEELVKMIKLCSDFTDYIQIDIMDGSFVPSKSVTVKDLKRLKLPLKSEAHLMVDDPLLWVKSFQELGTEKIIFHFEINADHEKIISEIQKVGLKAGIAVNPSTSIDKLKVFIDKVDTFLFMSVNPGFYGAEFIPEVLDKIKEFKDKYPHKIVGIDGGIKTDNLIAVKNSGVDYICIGSAIMKDLNPKQAYKKFSEVLNA